MQMINIFFHAKDVSGDGSCLFRAAVAAISPRKRESDLLQVSTAPLVDFLVDDTLLLTNTYYVTL